MPTRARRKGLLRRLTELDSEFRDIDFDGRVLNVFEPGKVHDPIGSDGRARVLGAGPLSFELIEPFRHWRLRLAGDAMETTVVAQMAGQRPEGVARVPVELELDIRSAVPPWENGALVPEAARVLEEQEEGALMGGPRFEQLFRATGTYRVDGQTHEVNGGESFGVTQRRRPVQAGFVAQQHDLMLLRQFADQAGYAYGSAVRRGKDGVGGYDDDARPRPR